MAGKMKKEESFTDRDADISLGREEQEEEEVA